MAKFCFVVLSLVAAVISNVSAGLTDEEKNAIKAQVIPILAECGKELEISKEDLIAAKKSEDTDAVNPCFYACFLKKAKIMDEEGKYAPDVAKAEHAKYIHDTELLEKLDAVSDKCVSVNEQEVSDGAKGCERAKLLVKCMSENKDIFTSIFKD